MSRPKLVLVNRLDNSRENANGEVRVGFAMCPYCHVKNFVVEGDRFTYGDATASCNHNEGLGVVNKENLAIQFARSKAA